MFSGDPRNKIVDSLLVHIEFLDAAAQRHELWAEKVADHETENVHLEIIGLIRQTREKYKTLIARYDGHSV